jgi:Putative GTPases (G3E family)
MTKVDIISGFLGAGKTTFIKKLLEEKSFGEEKLVLIENEFGEIGIDGALLKNSGIEIKEMNSGCICCTIAGDFSQALKEMLRAYHPDRIIIEPSGVGKLSDVIRGCGQFMKESEVGINICMTVVDCTKYKMYSKNFGEFYKDQLMNAKAIILSRTQNVKSEILEYVINDIKNYNNQAPLITTDWDKLSGPEIVKLAETTEEFRLENNMLTQLKASDKVQNKSLRDKSLQDKSFRIRDLKITGTIQKAHHHADEVFSVWSKETGRIFEYHQLEEILERLEQSKGIILRAKGIVRTSKDQWVQFDYVPGESSIRETAADFTGRICVIGENIDQPQLSELFGM